MKNMILVICCCLMIQHTHSQSTSRFYKKADSLYNAKDYKNAAVAYSEGIRLEGDAARAGTYWRTACGWSLAGNADSTFYYLSFIEKSNIVTVQDSKEIENDEDFDPVKSDKRWQPAMNAILSNAFSNTNMLSEAVRSGKRIYPSRDKYVIARDWATVKNIDSTLFYLNSIIKTDYNSYVEYNDITNEKTFSFLYKEPQWISLINEVQKNTPPPTCEHRQRSGHFAMKATIDPASEFLKSDGKGSYSDGEDKVSSNFFTAYNLLLSGIEPLQESGYWTDASRRYFTINLNKPIKGSGSVKQGIISDNFGTFHTFYKIDTAAKLDLIYNFNEIPISSTIESPRTDIHFFINHKLHMLTFGYWGMGDCGEPYACGGKVNGIGTTMVKITRHTATTYTIEAPKGSRGRLWDIDNRTKPVDKGLFESGFIIHVENL